MEQAVHEAVTSLQDRDPELAQQVIDGDSKIDQEENHIEEECLKILALHQPVAVDLRRIAAALKINTDLERMADVAEDIAERALHLAQLPPIPIPEKLQHMTNLTTQMVRQSLDCFVNLDTRQARVVCRMDDDVDHYNKEIIDELLLAMRQSRRRTVEFYSADERLTPEEARQVLLEPVLFPTKMAASHP